MSLHEELVCRKYPPAPLRSIPKVNSQSLNASDHCADGDHFPFVNDAHFATKRSASEPRMRSWTSS